MSKPLVDIAIVGGGFFGLALAYRLRQRNPDATIALFEASDRLGGKALTDRIETEYGCFLVEAGPDSFLAAKPWAFDLATALGLNDELLPINQVARPVSVVKQGRLIRMPAGLTLAAPSLLEPFVRSPLLSPSGRARVLREPYAPVRTSDGDETVGAFIRRRLGQEMLDWVAEPLMAGIYNGDPEQMSLLATFPQLRAQEREQGGLIRAARQARRNRRGSRPPAFLTFKLGMQTLTDALARAIGDVAALDSPVERIERDVAGNYVIHSRNGDRSEARQVVLATPARESARLIEAISPDIARRLAEFRTNPAGSISLAFRDAEIARALPGYGLLAPL
jgi:oxygen-dependent protoporphyrinogen oxidase